MKAYIITYEGVYLGGAAVVIAESRDQALELLAAHPDTQSLDDGLEVKEIGIYSAIVLYNDNGDY